MRIYLPIAFFVAWTMAWIYFRWIKKDLIQAKALLQWGFIFSILWIILYWLILN